MGFPEPQPVILNPSEEVVGVLRRPVKLQGQGSGAFPDLDYGLLPALPLPPLQESLFSPLQGPETGPSSPLLSPTHKWHRADPYPSLSLHSAAGTGQRPESPLTPTVLDSLAIRTRIFPSPSVGSPFLSGPPPACTRASLRPPSEAPL